MNANELADELNRKLSGRLIGFIATMLRQQQAEIEAFRKSHIELERGIVKDLNQRQSAEPVAWMYEKPNGASKLSFVKEKILWENMTETPLYTHPVKELTLTRDEIRDVWRKNPASFTLTPLTIEFARAILRKAQEK